MPCIVVHRNIPLGPEKVSEVQDRFAAIIEQVLSKPKAFIMVLIDDEKPIRFGGSDEPALFIEMKSIGLPGDTPKQLSEEICAAAQELLGISPDRIYIEFADSARNMWGWNGGTFG